MAGAPHPWEGHQGGYATLLPVTGLSQHRNPQMGGLTVGADMAPSTQRPTVGPQPPCRTTVGLQLHGRVGEGVSCVSEMGRC